MNINSVPCRPKHSALMATAALSLWTSASLAQMGMPTTCDFLQQQYQEARIEELQGNYQSAVAAYEEILNQHIDKGDLESEGASPQQCANTQATAGIVAAGISITKLNRLEQGRGLLRKVLSLADASQDYRDTARTMLDRLTGVH